MKALLSKLEDWELVNREQDIRGKRVRDAATGRDRGVVRDLLVDTDTQRVTAAVLGDGTALPLGPLAFRGRNLVLQAPEEPNDNLPRPSGRPPASQ
jgi:hypothetical protein